MTPQPSPNPRRSLPAHPTLEALKKQAKRLLAAHKAGDASVCPTLRLLSRYADASDDDILSAGLALNDAQFALALDYGFESWAALKKHVDNVLAIEPFSAVVFGRVTAKDGGRPIEDAEVRVELVGAIDIHHAYSCVRTDADGRYQCDLAWTGADLLSVHYQCRHAACKFHLGGVDEDDRHPSTSKRLRDGDRYELNIELREGYAVELTVQDDQGLPVVEAEVLLYATDGLTGGPFNTDYVTGKGDALLIFPKTDAQGRCRIEGLAADMPDGYQYIAAIEHDDFIYHMVTGIDKLARDGRVARATVPLGRGDSLSGRVLCAETGQPVDAATVLAGRKCDPDEFSDQTWGNGTSKVTTTGSDGRFTLKGLRSRPHHLVVRHPRWTSTRLEAVAVPSDQLLTIRLERGRTITGEVIDRNGQPAAGAEIQVRQVGRSFESFEITTHADQQGRFELGGLPADATLYLAAKDKDSVFIYFGLRTLDIDEDHIVFDARELVEAAGQVIDPASNRPVPIRVCCEALGTFPDGAIHLCQAVAPEADGRFHLLLPANGNICLHLCSDDDVFASPFMNQLDLTMRNGKPNRSLDVMAAVPLTLTVRVLDAKTDQPIAGAGVDITTASDNWGLGYSARTDVDGRASETCLPPCDVRIDVIAEGCEALREHHIKMPTNEEIVIRLTPKH